MLSFDDFAAVFVLGIYYINFDFIKLKLKKKKKIEFVLNEK